MNEDSVRRLLARALYDFVCGAAILASAITLLLLALEWGQLTTSARLALAAVVLVAAAGYAAMRRPRRIKPAATNIYTSIHPTPSGRPFRPGSFDVYVGRRIPVRGLGPEPVDGILIAATVADDGMSVELTMEVPPPGRA